ncbi:A/G-specific adenine glycosylase [Raineyella fluvialis]|uniref:A/G-specific adenine glycosylase n=1 Tax=Raineyella fluvialis TaxID=2662261 RepID=UPI001E443D45|nr:A/G-specific adenine glycosylase [Raineyella fluvialis]
MSRSPLPPADPAVVVTRVLAWYAENARDLPWRRPDCSPWGVMVSEFMLQQTPVARVLDPWRAWMGRWPQPAALAAEPSGEAIRMWGRLGYPRRALRLHAAARAIVESHAGAVPHTETALRALPGVGEYTAAAVAAFAYGQRTVVVDTNVRRLLARLVDGTPQAPPHPRAAERSLAAAHVPEDPQRAADWAVASMELGALVCTARSPRCEACPLADLCGWRHAGHPEGTYVSRTQTYEGTDRQCRGALLALLRDVPGPVATDQLQREWPDHRARDPDQFARALAGLARDGLIAPVGGGHWTLPTA